jgi:hypothetical protein
VASETEQLQRRGDRLAQAQSNGLLAKSNPAIND